VKSGSADASILGIPLCHLGLLDGASSSVSPVARAHTDPPFEDPHGFRHHRCQISAVKEPLGGGTLDDPSHGRRKHRGDEVIA